MTLPSRLVIIGAGPKAMAIAAKAHVLKKLGFITPEITIIEKNKVASHWDGCHGYTHGRQPLGTSPEKDVGFPYQSHCWGDEFNQLVDSGMLAFCWQNFLIQNHQYSEWIDRGRPAPDHRKWSQYLRWVFEIIQNDVQFQQQEVTNLEINNNKWFIRAGNFSLEADGVVVTGPGTQRGLHHLPIHPNVFTLETFWKNLDRMNEIPKGSHFAIIGCGETAASVVLYLGHLRSDLRIDLIVPTAMSYSRGESFVENHVYTDPFQSNWMSWTVEDRIHFIQRTDRGVFSLSSKKWIDQWDFIEIIPGYFRNLKINSDSQLVLELEYKGELERRVYQTVVFSLGFDPWGQISKWLDSDTKNSIQSQLGVSNLGELEIESQMAEDLSIRTVTPKLHIPMLSILNQGPGFGNLSCLGRLSDQILQSYVGLEFSEPFR